ncbi:MAG: enoyl-CoA hydratase [Candidatus Binatia bacterium]|nr:MAG: enoyl-CoA hydratase [Candidatus Binatia bacterium]
MEFQNIRLDHGTVARVTLSRPERRNALSLAMMRELIDAFEFLAEREDTRVVVLAAEGPAFCAGHDLAEMRNRDARFYRQLFDHCTRLMEAIQEIPQPVIARVQGIATAAGCQLVASCDLAVAADVATFATPGVRIGLFCSTPMVALTRAIGRKRAMEMLLTGTPIDAATACSWGLVNRVVPAGRLDDAVQELADRIVAASPLTVSLGKQAFYRQIELDQHQAYAYAREVMSLNAMASDAQEGMCAFLEKRAPRWSGR